MAGLTTAACFLLTCLALVDFTYAREKCTGPNEVWQICSRYCENCHEAGCSDICIDLNSRPGCFCKKGYCRLSFTGVCAPCNELQTTQAVESSIECGQDEVWRFFSKDCEDCNIHGCAHNCNDSKMAWGCFCRPNFCKKGGRCVPCKENPCLPSSSNTEVIHCSPACEKCTVGGCSNYCEDRAAKFACFCKRNYCRNTKGECKPRQLTSQVGPVCPRDEEYKFSSPFCESCTGGGCVDKCTDSRSKYGCYCKKEYCRNNKGQCQPCPPPVTCLRPDEEYKLCSRRCESCNEGGCNGYCNDINQRKDCYCKATLCRSPTTGRCVPLSTSAMAAAGADPICRDPNEIWKKSHPYCDECNQKGCQHKCYHSDEYYGCFCRPNFCKQNGRCVDCPRYGQCFPKTNEVIHCSISCQQCSRGGCSNYCPDADAKYDCFCPRKYCVENGKCRPVKSSSLAVQGAASVVCGRNEIWKESHPYCEDCRQKGCEQRCSHSDQYYDCFCRPNYCREGGICVDCVPSKFPCLKRNYEVIHCSRSCQQCSRGGCSYYCPDADAKYDCFCKRNYCVDENGNCVRVGGVGVAQYAALDTESGLCGENEERKDGSPFCENCHQGGCAQVCSDTNKTNFCWCKKNFCRKNGKCIPCRPGPGNCPKNEEYRFCSRNCEYCEVGGCDRPCNDPFRSLGCYCKRGYCRSGYDRECYPIYSSEVAAVAQSESIFCPPYEEFKKSSKFCENCKGGGCYDCWDSNSVYGCYCIKDYCRNEQGNCVLCPGRCRPDEEYKLCAPKCESCQYGGCGRPCDAPFQYTACYCKKGLCRNKIGECERIPSYEVAAQSEIIFPCPTNEVYARSSSNCERCDAFGCFNNCDDPENSYYGCFCRKNYCRNRNGVCELCQGKCRDDEEYKVCSRKCDSCNYGGCATKCDSPIQISGCYCQTGYCRTGQNECVPMFSTALSAQADEESSKPSLCYLDPERGPCPRRIRRYFFNWRSGRCEVFDWSGCGGNGNNFETEQKCYDTCGEKCPLINEEYKVCSALCDKDCRCNGGCNQPSQVPGCYCKRGFCRNQFGECRRPPVQSQSVIICKSNEEYKEGSIFCEACFQGGCANSCSHAPSYFGCWCKKGFCRDAYYADPRGPCRPCKKPCSG